ncbi:MAG: hypothetical protein NWE95_13725 [Candidatus Bathyarchaeota archaeon]|nr:hypothetical protein [Candidatus Bathyarchaeota archaeon]
MHLTITDNQVLRDNQPVVIIDSLPNAVIRQVINDLAKSLKRAGYCINDQRTKRPQQCDCGKPTAFPNGNYCADCLREKRAKNARQFWSR